MALGTSCPLHNWVSPGAGGQGSYLEAQEATSGHEVGKCVLYTGRKGESKGTGLGRPSTRSSAGQAHSNPMGLSAVREQGRAGSRTQGQVQGSGEGADLCCPLLSLIDPNNLEKGLRGSSRAQNMKLRVSLVWECHGHQAGAGTAVFWPPVPLVCFRGTQAAPRVLSTSKTDCLVGGPSVQPHALKSKPGKHTTLVLDLSMLPLPPGQNHLSSMNVIKNHSLHQPQVQSPTGIGTPPRLTTRKRNGKERPVEAGL